MLLTLTSLNAWDGDCSVAEIQLPARPGNFKTPMHHAKPAVPSWQSCVSQRSRFVPATTEAIECLSGAIPHCIVLRPLVLLPPGSHSISTSAPRVSGAKDFMNWNIRGSTSALIILKPTSLSILSSSNSVVFSLIEPFWLQAAAYVSLDKADKL